MIRQILLNRTWVFGMIFVLLIGAFIGVQAMNGQSRAEKPDAQPKEKTAVPKTEKSPLETAILVSKKSVQEYEQISNSAKKPDEVFKPAKFLKKAHRKQLAHWQLAAKHNSPEGLALVALCLQEGIGLKKDEKAAFNNCHKAAAQNFPLAQFILGMYYIRGIGVPKQDMKEGMKWHLKAAAQGHARAQFCIGLGHAQGFGGITKNTTNATIMYIKSATQGFAPAQFQLGITCIVNGDKTGGAKWLGKAAAQGHLAAKTMLEKLEGHRRVQRLIEQRLRRP